MYDNVCIDISILDMMIILLEFRSSGLADLGNPGLIVNTILALL